LSFKIQGSIIERKLFGEDRLPVALQGSLGVLLGSAALTPFDVVRARQGLAAFAHPLKVVR
jgi:hypothetical protein